MIEFFVFSDGIAILKRNFGYGNRKINVDTRNWKNSQNKLSAVRKFIKLPFTPYNQICRGARWFHFVLQTARGPEKKLE